MFLSSRQFSGGGNELTVMNERRRAFIYGRRVNADAAIRLLSIDGAMSREKKYDSLYFNIIDFPHK